MVRELWLWSWLLWWFAPVEVGGWELGFAEVVAGDEEEVIGAMVIEADSVVGKSPPDHHWTLVVDVFEVEAGAELFGSFQEVVFAETAAHRQAAAAPLQMWAAEAVVAVEDVAELEFQKAG